MRCVLVAEFPRSQKAMQLFPDRYSPRSTAALGDCEQSGLRRELALIDGDLLRCRAKYFLCVIPSASRRERIRRWSLPVKPAPKRSPKRCGMPGLPGLSRPNGGARAIPLTAGEIATSHAAGDSGAGRKGTGECRRSCGGGAPLQGRDDAHSRAYYSHRRYRRSRRTESADDLRQRVLRSVFIHAGCRRRGVDSSPLRRCRRYFAALPD